MDLDLLISKIIESTQLSGEEVLHNINAKRKEFDDLIDQESAAKIIARELGISVEQKEHFIFQTLADISSQKPFDAICIVRVMNISSPKVFETERKSGRVCNIEVADNSGRGVLVFWDEDVYWMEKNKMERDDVLVVKGGQVKSYNPLEMHSSLLTELSIIRPSDFQNSPLYKALPVHPIRSPQIKDFKEGETLDFIGRVIQVGEIREYQKDAKKSRVVNILVGDSNGEQIGVSLWDYNADFASKNLKAGGVIKLESAIVKKTMAGFELSLNWNSHIIAEPLEHKLVSQEEMLKGILPTIRILDLKAGEKGIVKAYLGKINKAELKNNELTVEADIRDEISVPVKFSGKQALEILQIRNLPTIPIDLIVKLKEDYIKGKRLSMVISKHRDKTGTVARHYCDQVLNFI